MGQRNPVSLPILLSAMAQFMGEPPALATSSRTPSDPTGLLMRSIRLSPPTTNMGCASCAWLHRAPFALQGAWLWSRAPREEEIQMAKSGSAPIGRRNIPGLDKPISLVATGFENFKTFDEVAKMLDAFT